VLVPRLAVTTVLDDATIEQARSTLVESGRSRAPVVHSGDLDDVVGVVHLRDLLADHRAVGTAVRPALQLPDSLHVSDALQRFKTEREHFALVVDERGGLRAL
jgi:putative hemolysin